MAIEKKQMKDLSSDLRTNYQTAMGALDKNNTDYAVMLLKGVIQREPGFMEAREQLRTIEKKKAQGAGAFTKWFSGFKTSGTVTAGKAMLSTKKPLKAMAKAEDALAVSLTSLPALNLLAQAAIEAEADFVAIEALEIATEYYPKNIAILDWLARIYADNKMGVKALQCRQKIVSIKPNDLEAQQKVREAAALASMEKGNWEDRDSDFHSKLKDKDEADRLEQKERIVRSVDDVRDNIEAMEKKIADGDESLDLRRSLADLYLRAEEYDKALKFYEDIVERMESLDPFIDRAIEKCNVAKLNNTIQEWKEFGASDPAKKEEADKNIADITKQINDYRLERANYRVENYPNDMQLRYDLAVANWDCGQIDDALQQFQMSQKNPQRRLSSLVYIGRCFHSKKQYDLATEQFEKAISDMHAMNREKMDALYYLGICCEEMGNTEKAAANFKQIYQADIKYRDVAERMEKLYRK